jgi:hypothetical protein
MHLDGMYSNQDHTYKHVTSVDACSGIEYASYASYVSAPLDVPTSLAQQHHADCCSYLGAPQLGAVFGALTGIAATVQLLSAVPVAAQHGRTPSAPVREVHSCAVRPCCSLTVSKVPLVSLEEREAIVIPTSLSTQGLQGIQGCTKGAYLLVARQSRND